MPEKTDKQLMREKVKGIVKNAIAEDNTKRKALKEKKEQNTLSQIHNGTTISYKGDNYTVTETPSEENKNKYILTHESGKPVYKLTAKQLFAQIDNGNAQPMMLETVSQEKIIVDQIDMGELVDKKSGTDTKQENSKRIARELQRAIDDLTVEEKLPSYPYELLKRNFKEAGFGESISSIDFGSFPVYDLLKAKEILQNLAEDHPECKGKKEFQIYLERVSFFLKEKGIEEPTEDMPEPAPDAADLMAKALGNINRITRQPKEEDSFASITPESPEDIKNEFMNAREDVLEREKEESKEVKPKEKREGRIWKFLRRNKEKKIGKEKQAEKEETKEKIRNIIEELQYQKGNDEVLISSLESELSQLQAEAEALEKDQKENPFKYFLIENMHDRAFFCIISSYKSDVTFEDINRCYADPSGKNISYSGWKYLLPGRNDTLQFSSNGFTLQLQNKEEVTSEDSIKVDSPEARYSVVNPRWEFVKQDLTYEEGINLLHQEAEKYQKEMLAKFEAQK